MGRLVSEERQSRAPQLHSQPDRPTLQRSPAPRSCQLVSHTRGMKPFSGASCRDRTGDFHALVERLRQEGNAATPSGAVEASGPYPAARTNGALVQQQTDFSRRAAAIGQGIHATSQKLFKLSQLAKQTSMFNDPAVEINEVSTLIKQDIQALNTAIVELQNVSAASREGNRQAVNHTHTVVDQLRMRLKDTTKEFSDVLTLRQESLKVHNERRQLFTSSDKSTLGRQGRPVYTPVLPAPSASRAQPMLRGGSQAASHALLANGASTSRGADDASASEQCAPRSAALEPHPVPTPAPVLPVDTSSSALRRRGKAPPPRHPVASNLPQAGTAQQAPVPRQPLLAPRAQQQQQLLAPQDTYLTSRAQALQNVESTIHELGGIFQQLAHMVQEQGEVAIRIDENVDETLANVESTQQQLMKYLNSISSNRWLIMKVFAVLMVFLVIFMFIA